MSKTKLTYVESCDLEGSDASLYDLATVEDKIIMSYSKYDSAWTPGFSGETAVTLKDTEEGVVISFNDMKKKIKLDYSQVLMLQMLLKYYNEDSPLQGRYTHSFAKLVSLKEPV